MNKVIKINPKTTRAFVQIFNGMLNLTDKEIIVLAAFIDKYKEVREHNIDVFSAPIKKQIADTLEMDNFNVLNNYIKAFKDKGAIRHIKGAYQFNPVLIREKDEEGVLFQYV